MALLILTDNEIKLLYKNNPDAQTLKDTINKLAGDLGGHGIDIVDINLRPVLSKEFSSSNTDIVSVLNNLI